VVVAVVVIAVADAEPQVGAALDPAEVNTWPDVPNDGVEPTPNARLVFNVSAVVPALFSVRAVAAADVMVLIVVVPLSV
jgi:hypothetical protein